jgi:glycosyltransferase involved in cell wall biosynthesis
MHICHVILTNRFAGSERYAVDLANASVVRHQVSVVLRKRAAQNRPDAIAHRFDARVKIHLIPDWFSGLFARRLLRQLRPDVIHAHLSAACKSAAMVRAGKRIATLHIEYKPQQHAKLDGLIAIAPWQLAKMPEAMRARSVQINNWVVPRAASSDARSLLRTQLGIAPETVLIGSISRLEPSKGVDVLLAAFAKLTDVNAHLVVVGQGSAAKALRAAAPAGVSFVGFAAKPQDYLAAMDVFVSASRSEPFGLVILEAMSAGLPILASASAGAQHLARFIQRPLLPIGDVAVLQQALLEIIKKAPARLTYELSQFDQDTSVRAIEAFYQSP